MRDHISHIVHLESLKSHSMFFFFYKPHRFRGDDADHGGVTEELRFSGQWYLLNNNANKNDLTATITYGDEFTKLNIIANCSMDL